MECNNHVLYSRLHHIVYIILCSRSGFAIFFILQCWRARLCAFDSARPRTYIIIAYVFTRDDYRMRACVHTCVLVLRTMMCVVPWESACVRIIRACARTRVCVHINDTTIIASTSCFFMLASVRTDLSRPQVKVGWTNLEGCSSTVAPSPATSGWGLFRWPPRGCVRASSVAVCASLTVASARYSRYAYYRPRPSNRQTSAVQLRRDVGGGLSQRSATNAYI